MKPLHDRDGWLWQDGEWLPWREARTHLLTHTLHYGMGCFEGVRAYAGPNGTHLFRVGEHTRRLLDSAHALDIPLSFSADELIEAQRECLKRNALASDYLKPTVYLGAESMRLRSQVLSTQVVLPAWDLCRFISLDIVMIVLRVLTFSWSYNNVNISLCCYKTNGHYVNS